jgi:Zn-finger nucleic acid-binding protein
MRARDDMAGLNKLIENSKIENLKEYRQKIKGNPRKDLEIYS